MQESPTGVEPAAEGLVEPGAEPEAERGAATGSRRRRRLRYALAVLAVTVVVASALAGGAALYLGRQFSGTPDPAARSRGIDAIWLGHAWVDGRKTETDVRALAARLGDGGFRDVYVHAGPLEDDGSWQPSQAPRLAWFVEAMADAAPRVRVQAWLGNVLSDDRLDISDPDARQRISAAVGAVLAQGVAGVHFDLEPLRDGDQNFLTVLDDARRQTTARAAVLSVAAEPVEPFRFAEEVVGRFRPAFWSRGYLAEVASRVDQIAMMTYDSTLRSERLYGGVTARQLRVALDVVPEDVDLLAGLPAYHDTTAGHDPKAETVPAAIRAARLALSDDLDRRNFGVAIYVDYAATEEDWAAYRTGWLAPSD